MVVTHHYSQLDTLPSALSIVSSCHCICIHDTKDIAQTRKTDKKHPSDVSFAASVCSSLQLNTPHNRLLLLATVSCSDKFVH